MLAHMENIKTCAMDADFACIFDPLASHAREPLVLIVSFFPGDMDCRKRKERMKQVRI